MADLMVGGAALLDMDDTIGGAFQEAFWDQLKLLWVAPGELDEALEIWEEKVQ
jgi:multiple sugar transport system substrate-binding protein